ncbi:MAG: hypothetical protein DRI71_07765 [Bacteroidetes bacterium]|nr:MAG: hypothetical protein DRI71_07765 [Bacteroidota bacterium]
MKTKIFALLSLSILLFSCGGSDEEIIPDEPVGKSTTVITGAISTTLEYEAEFFGGISTADPGNSSIILNFGNIGQTESAVIFNLIEAGNKLGFAPGTFNYSNDPDPDIIFFGYYIDANDSYSINPDAGAVNKLVIKTITDTKITGEIELNLEAGIDGAKIKLVGTFEAIGEIFRL